MAKASAKFTTGKRVVADADSQVERSLSVLRNQRKYTWDKTVLYEGDPTGVQVAEQTKSARVVQLDEFQQILGVLPTAKAKVSAQPVYTVALFVRLTEEPDVGNPQVRFCEGH